MASIWQFVRVLQNMAQDLGFFSIAWGILILACRYTRVLPTNPSTPLLLSSSSLLRCICFCPKPNAAAACKMEYGPCGVAWCLTLNSHRLAKGVAFDCFELELSILSFVCPQGRTTKHTPAALSLRRCASWAERFFAAPSCWERTPWGWPTREATTMHPPPNPPALASGVMRFRRCTAGRLGGSYGPTCSRWARWVTLSLSDSADGSGSPFELCRCSDSAVENAALNGN